MAFVEAAAAAAGVGAASCAMERGVRWRPSSLLGGDIAERAGGDASACCGWGLCPPGTSAGAPGPAKGRPSSRKEGG